MITPHRGGLHISFYIILFFSSNKLDLVYPISKDPLMFTYKYAFCSADPPSPSGISPIQFHVKYKWPGRGKKMANIILDFGPMCIFFR